MSEGDLLNSTAMTIYVVTATLLWEEPDLCRDEDIGDTYIQYTHEVPAFCPLRANGCFCSRKKENYKSKKA